MIAIKFAIDYNSIINNKRRDYIMLKYQIDGFIASQIVSVSHETNLFEVCKSVILNELHNDIVLFNSCDYDAEGLADIAREHITWVNASNDINDLNAYFDIYEI